MCHRWVFINGWFSTDWTPICRLLHVLDCCITCTSGTCCQARSIIFGAHHQSARQEVASGRPRRAAEETVVWRLAASSGRSLMNGCRWHCWRRPAPDVVLMQEFLSCFDSVICSTWVLCELQFQCLEARKISTTFNNSFNSVDLQ